MPYHRGAAELEEAGASLDSHLDTVDELLTLALQPRKEGLGGVDQYLIQKLAQSRPLDIKSAMARLCRGMQNSIKVPACPCLASLVQLHGTVLAFASRSVDTRRLLFV